MFKKIISVFLLLIIILFSCTKNNKNSNSNNSSYIFKQELTKEKLPDDLIWITNDNEQIISSSEAKKGGIVESYLMSFPNTFRTVGPDSNNSFAGDILENQLSLIELHPNTEKIIPELATHWAFDKDHKTMYFQLNKDAKWSDGKPVTAQDYAYTLEFMRSKEIVAPFYNDYYSKFIDKILIYDDYTLSISATKPLPDLFYHLNISPTPRQFYGKLDKNFITKYNWKITPNTGPYQIKSFKKGENIVFERKKDWWAKDLKYFQNRFNADKIFFKVVRDQNIWWELFKNGQLYIHGLTHPTYWHDKSNIDIFKNGYADKIMFYYDSRQPAWGMYLNQDKEIFKDKNLRYAFAYGMNFNEVNKTILRNEYYRLDQDFEGYGKYTNKKIKARPFDLNKVEYYMTKSGWSRGNDGIWQKGDKRFSVEVTYTADLDTDRLVILKEEAKKAGIELKLDKLDSSSAYKKVMEKNHDVAWWIWSTDFRPEYWQGYHSDNAHKPQTNNISNTDNKELDKLIDKYRFSIDENERISLSLIIQEKLYDICPFVPVFMIPYQRWGYWRWIKLPKVPGAKTNNDNLFEPFNSSYGGLFWFDQNTFNETKEAMKKGIKFPETTIIDETYKMEILKNK